MNAHGHSDVAVDHNGGSDSQLEDFLEDNFNEDVCSWSFVLKRSGGPLQV